MQSLSNICYIFNLYCSCGPTVYDFAHIGNFRAFLTYDLIKRWLQYCGYDVDHVCNLTDVDDKIIVKMNSDGKNLMDITNKYTEAFFDDLKVKFKTSLFLIRFFSFFNNTLGSEYQTS